MIQSEYINELVNRLNLVLQKKLISLYIIGSTSFGDYIENRSDIDVFGITNSSLTTFEKDQLEKILNETKKTCLAAGLDIVLMTKQNVEVIKNKPSYEFWFSAGMNWPEERWSEGSSTEMLILIELCRQNGIKIYESEQSINFQKVDSKLILNALKQILHWQMGNLLDDFHDPKGQNSVLNACRILQYIETNRFHSKTNGGKQFLIREPSNLTVQKALRIRQNNSTENITEEEILRLIKQVERRIDQALSK